MAMGRRATTPMGRRASWNRRSAGALALGVVALCLLAYAATRVAMLQFADHWARSAPERALALVPAHPEAALALAARQLARGDAAAADATARRLLAAEPAAGEAFRVLALAAERRGDAAAATRAMRIAVRRAPRDMAARGWLAEDAIARGDHAAGLVQLEAVMRLSPRHVDLLVPMIATLADDPRFALALQASLDAQPRWASMLAEQLDRRRASSGAAPPVPATERVRTLGLGDRVAGLVDPRGLVPAGR